MNIRSGFKKSKRERGLHFLKRLRMPDIRLPRKFLKKRKPGSARNYLNRDIHKKDFSNPNKKGARFVRGVSQKILGYRNWYARIALVGILSIWFYVLFFQGVLYIDKIQIRGTKEIDPGALTEIINKHLEKRSLLLVKRSHRFFINKSKLVEEISSRYGLDELIIEPHWPSGTLSIVLKEKTSVLAYNAENQYFTIDRKGTIVRKIENFESIDAEQDIPLIYRYSATGVPEISDQVLDEIAIESILKLHAELKKYTAFTVHSFRLKESKQRAIAFDEKVPYQSQASSAQGATKEDQEEKIEQALDSIAQAQTIDQKVELLKTTIDGINLEKLEEDRVKEILKDEKRFDPNPDYRLEELEVYMNEGWSIKMGHDVLSDSASVEKHLQYFATLGTSVNVGEEVSEYVDLRFPGRIYYR